MAETVTIFLNTQAQTQGIRAVVSGLNQVKGVADGVGRIVTGVTARLAGMAAGVVGIHAVTNGLKGAVERGIQFNRTIEDSRLGIAAILKQFNPGAFKNFSDALAASGNALDQLKRKAVESPASFAQLVQGFQGITGAATSAGVALNDQVELVVLMSQALAGLGIRSEQLLQESRALITGNINEDAMAARILGITRADIEQARQQGRVYDFLRERLSAFSEAGKIGTQNLSVALSNLGDVAEQKLGAITLPIFEAIKRGVLGLTQAINEANLTAAFGGIAERLAQMAAGVLNFGKAVAENIGVMQSSRFGEFLGLMVEAGLEEGFKRGALLGDSALRRMFENVFSSDFVIFAAKAGKLLTHSLLTAVKIPVDVLGASFEWLAERVYNLFVNAFNKFAKVFIDIFNGTFNTLVEGLNKIKIFGEFAPIQFKIDPEVLLPERTFADLLEEKQRASADATKSLLGYFDDQIAKTKELLELGKLQSDQDETRLSALERMQQLLQEVKAQQMAETEGGLTEADFQPANKINMAAGPKSRQQLVAETEEKRKQLETEIAQAELEVQRLRTRGAIHEQTGRTVGTLQEEAAEIRKTLAHMQELVEAKGKLRREMEGGGLISSTEAREMELRDARELLAIQQQLVGLKYELNDFTFFERLSEGMTELGEQFNEIGASIADVLVNGIGSAIKTVSDGIWQVIDGTATWGQLFTQVGRQVISGLIQIAIQELILDNLKRGIAMAWKAFTSAMRVADVAEANATEAAKTPALAVNATMASISSWGVAAIIGVAAIAAVLATMGAFEKGGVVHGGEQIIRVNERGTESVLNARATSMLGADMINRLNAGAAGIMDLEGRIAANVGGSVPSPAEMGGLGGAGSVPGVPTDGGQPTIDVHILVVSDRGSQAAREFMESAAGKAIIVDTITDEKTTVGIS